MRNRLWTGLLLATVWTGAAMAQAPDATPAASDCAAAQAALAAAPSPSAELQARLETACSAATATTQRDPETERALEQWRRGRQHAIAIHVRELMASQDARQQLAAALLRPMTGDTRVGGPMVSTAAFAAALRLGRNDPLVAWMEVLACPRNAGMGACDPRAALIRLQRLEPGNAAPSAIAAGLALKRGDRATADRQLERAAQASRYQLPFGDIAELLYAQLLEAGGPPLDAPLAAALGQDLGLARAATAEDFAAVGAMAIAAAISLPGFAPLERLCVEQNAASDRRHASCTALLSLMAQSDTLLARNVGLAFLQRLTAGTPGAANWSQQRRELRWLMARGGEVLRDNGGSTDYLHRVWRDGEVAALESLLAANGQPLAPPPGWVPPG